MRGGRLIFWADQRLLDPRSDIPNPDFTDLIDDYSGNEVNGLGEEELRRPSMVWWTPDMDEASFGDAQKWFYQREQPDDENADLLRPQPRENPSGDRTRQLRLDRGARTGCG